MNQKAKSVPNFQEKMPTLQVVKLPKVNRKMMKLMVELGIRMVNLGMKMLNLVMTTMKLVMKIVIGVTLEMIWLMAFLRWIL